MLRNLRVADQECRSPIVERDTPDAKRQKRDISTPKHTKVKVEPLDWEKACNSVSPSKVHRNASQETHLTSTPPNGKDTTVIAPEIQIRKDIFASRSVEDSELKEGEITKENLAPEPKRTFNSHSQASSHFVYRVNETNLFDYFGNKFIMKNNQIRASCSQTLCFRCKCYGHTRSECKNNRNIAWPKSYTQRNPWIHEKFRDLRLRGGRSKMGLFEYEQAHQKIEDEAVKRIRGEESRRRKYPNGHCDRASANYEPVRAHLDIGARPHPPNRFEHPFPKAHRRLQGPGNTSDSSSNSVQSINSSKSNSPNEPPVLLLTSSQSLNFLELIKSMQNQIDELQESCRRLQLQTTK